MAKAFRIEEKRAGGPMPMLVGEYALEHKNLLSVGMIVRGKPRVWVVAHDRRNLARFRRTHQVDSLTPDRPARTRRPFHLSRVDHRADREIPVDCRFIHGGLFSRDGTLDRRLPSETANRLPAGVRVKRELRRPDGTKQHRE